MKDDLISRRVAVDVLWNEREKLNAFMDEYIEKGYSTLRAEAKAERNRIEEDIYILKQLPSAQTEPLTDKEQRIFLAAIEREEKVCEEVDRNHVREPYEDSLMRVCKEIRRKVKGALWTI